jgi:hypothetical protein
MDREKMVELFGRLEAEVTKMGTKDYDKKAILGRVFELNNEIGRTARVEPRRMQAMKDLQVWVNGVTSAVKHGETKRALEALTEARRVLLKLTGAGE